MSDFTLGVVHWRYSGTYYLVDGMAYLTLEEALEHIDLRVTETYDMEIHISDPQVRVDLGCAMDDTLYERITMVEPRVTHHPGGTILVEELQEKDNEEQQ